jgi:transposase
VRHLHEQGWHQVAIADVVGISLKTVRRYLAAAVFPERRPRHYPSKLDSFKGYLLQRWNEGCHNAVRLAGEIHQQGYPGGITQVRDYLARLRRAAASHPQPAITPLETLLTTSPLTPRRAAYLLLRPPDENEEADREFLAPFFARFPELRASIELFRTFATLVREKRTGAFDAWIHQVLHSDCAALKQFARGLQSDEEAVRAALSLSWSSGQCEGQINRLKFIKRQGYGRAKFDLLRIRVLHPT